MGFMQLNKVGKEYTYVTKPITLSISTAGWRASLDGSAYYLSYLLRTLRFAYRRFQESERTEAGLL
jgi:hypothetical protein